MSKEEIKQEITKTLDRFSEQALQDILAYLQQIHSQQSISIFAGDHFKRLLEEDKELLKRLAQ